MSRQFVFVAVVETRDRPFRVDLCLWHIRCDRRPIKVGVGPSSATFRHSTLGGWIVDNRRHQMATAPDNSDPAAGFYSFCGIA